MAAPHLTPLSVKVDQETKARMQRLADARDRPTHWVMIEAIKQFLDREEKRESFKQAAIQAWNNYQQTGLHVSSADANAWLAQLAAGKHEAPPKSHI